MMKLLLDESVPKILAGAFPANFTVHTVQQMGWAGTRNGKLLELAKENDYRALITADNGIEHQQNISELEVMVIVLKAYRTHIDYLAPLVPQVLVLLEEVAENGVHVVGE